MQYNFVTTQSQLPLRPTIDFQQVMKTKFTNQCKLHITWESNRLCELPLFFDYKILLKFKKWACNGHK